MPCKHTVQVIATRLCARGVLDLLDVYAKSAKEDLTGADKREIRGLVFRKPPLPAPSAST